MTKSRCSGEDFAEICQQGDELFDKGLYQKAAEVYWQLVSDSYREGEPLAASFLSPDLWRFYEEEDFYEFAKWCGALPAITRCGDRENLADLLEDIGDCHQALGDLNEAERMYRLAVAHTPANSRFHFALGSLLQRKGDPLAQIVLRHYEALEQK